MIKFADLDPNIREKVLDQHKVVQDLYSCYLDLHYANVLKRSINSFFYDHSQMRKWGRVQFALRMYISGYTKCRNEHVPIEGALNSFGEQAYEDCDKCFRGYVRA